LIKLYPGGRGLFSGIISLLPNRMPYNQGALTWDLTVYERKKIKHKIKVTRSKNI